MRSMLERVQTLEHWIPEWIIIDKDRIRALHAPVQEKEHSSHDWCCVAIQQFLGGNYFGLVVSLPSSVTASVPPYNLGQFCRG
jgi:hypothetical protein